MNVVETIENQLSLRIGVVPDTLGPEAVKLGVERRCRILECESPRKYLRILQENEEEWPNFIDEIVVPESWFFRDTIPFERLADAVRKRLARIGPENPLRALSTPCATGEEPYSIGMTLLDLGLPPDSFHIKGVDISNRVVSRSRSGSYGPLSFRGENLSFREEYFDSLDNNRWRIRPPLRGKILFEQGNLTAPDFLSRDPLYDIIFCRNVMIYLDQESRKQALANLDRLLGEGGLVFLGHAEVTTDVLRKFAPVKWPGAFAFRKRSAGSPTPPSLQRKARAFDPRPGTLLRKTTRIPDPRSGTRVRVTPQDPLPARKESDPEGTREPHADRTAPGFDLARAQQLANQGQTPEARLICERFIESSGYDAKACYLLGIIHLAEGKDEEAKLNFGRTVYLEPTHGDAMIHLFHLALASGNKDEAERWQHRLERVASRGGTK